MKVKLKKENGIVGSDALIAILIITLFVGLISSLIYNIYLSNSSLKRMSKANSYIIDLAEYTEKIFYDDVTEQNLIEYFNGKYNNEEAKAQSNSEEPAKTPFAVIIGVQNYNQTEGNTEKLDLIKEITITIKYKLGNKNQELSIKKIKSRENLNTPNKPNLGLLNVQEGQIVNAIKKVNEDSYIVCNTNDVNWYNYDNNEYAKVIITNSNVELKIGDIINEIDGTIYKWIPRYAENADGDIKYLYSNTDKYIYNQDGYKKLADTQEGYTISSSFGNNEGIWEQEV